MTISVAIMHAAFVPERRLLLQGLLRRLDRASAVALDVVKDNTKQGVWPVAQQAWACAFKHGATHHLVLQDDVVPCRDLIATLEKAAADRPEAAICAYSNEERSHRARKDGLSWIKLKGRFVWAPALLLPVDWVRRWLEWDACNVVQYANYDDARCGLFLHVHALDRYLTVPSLVDHLPVKSVLGHAGHTSFATEFAGEGTSGLGIDWATEPDGAVDPGSPMQWHCVEGMWKPR